jgi:nitroimidazol reductase NimA-like FMN-containing flavoprotein (pyridoxamine 5'-phosphate oxidase superfamily)
MRRLDDVAVMEDLEPSECRRLMGTQGIGRVAFVVDGEPAVLPVTFAIIGEVVVFRTALGSSFDALVRDSEVAFEVDQVDPAYHSGWSVVGRGTARGLEGQIEHEVLDSLPLRPWGLQMAPGWIGIVLREVTGRRIIQVPPALAR